MFHNVTAVGCRIVAAIYLGTPLMTQRGEARIAHDSVQLAGAGCSQCPTPELASECHGNFSPGSFLRAGATSEWPSTRCETTLRRSMMPRHSAITAAIWRDGYSG